MKQIDFCDVLGEAIEEAKEKGMKILYMTEEEEQIYGRKIEIGEEGIFEHDGRLYLEERRNEVSMRGKFCWLGIRLLNGVPQTWNGVMSRAWAVHWYF